jgi:hypothetical protein
MINSEEYTAEERLLNSVDKFEYDDGVTLIE